MNTKTLQYIITIAEEQSISLAAEKLFLSQPVLSRHLRQVEEEIGTALFIRSNNGVALTRAGVIYIHNARAILHVEQQLQQTLSSMRRQEKNNLTLLMEPSLINFFFKQILPIFKAKYPEYNIIIRDVAAQNIPDELRQHKADYGIISSAITEFDDINCVCMYTEELVLALPKDISCNSLNELKELVKYKLAVALHPKDNAFHSLELACLTKWNVYPHTTMELVTFNDSLRALHLGQCCAFYPHTIIKSCSLNNTLTEKVPFTYNVVALYSKNQLLNKPSLYLLSLLTEKFSHLGEWKFNSVK